MLEELLIITGPTAAGKTTAGVAVAEAVGGEVISADAFAVYRGLDIGTAKPEPALRRRVPHHLVDVAEPARRYSAGEFLRAADAAILDIRSRGKRPIVVGGTLFYVHALLYGLFPEPPKDPAVRAALEAAWRRDAGEVRGRLESVDPEAAAHIAPADRQRTLRALEVWEVSGRPVSSLWRDHPVDRPRYRFRMLALDPPRQELHATIALRVGNMFSAGLLDEVRGLVTGGVPMGAHALKAIGYRECCSVIRGELSEEEAGAATVVATRQLAKRQLTWLRREQGVEWVRGERGGLVAETVSRVEERGGARTRSAEGWS